jgi:hypothetical protein
MRFSNFIKPKQHNTYSLTGKKATLETTHGDALGARGGLKGRKSVAVDECHGVTYGKRRIKPKKYFIRHSKKSTS